MSFAGAWLDKSALFPGFIKEAPDKATGIIVVVPAFNEPGITNLLDSLAQCDEPGCKVEVIIVINAPPFADQDSLFNNKRTAENIESWKKHNNKSFFRLFVLDTGQPEIPGWGAGLARKTGMDEALRRFDIINNKDGAIVSLDADCMVAKNYFHAICNDLFKSKEHQACSIYFEHPLSGNEFKEDIYKYITLYELHLRYYVQGLRYSGFPYAFHTIGSAIAFKAIQYVKAGGMNRKQAGEDFYFIQKLVVQEGYFSLNSTTVFPSPRESLRVPFGTGPAMARLIERSEKKLLTYNVVSFCELRNFFNMVPEIISINDNEIPGFYNSLPPGLRSFIDEKEWTGKIMEIRANTSGESSLIKRFFGWFNMFRVVKYLNHVHTRIFEKQDVAEAASELLSLSGFSICSGDTRDLLLYYRSIEKH